MPPPNTPTEGAPAPPPIRRGRPPTAANRSPSKSPSRDQPRIARAFPVTFTTLLSLSQLRRPLLFLTALSVLPAVRARFYLTWRGRYVLWPWVSDKLWWAAAATWLSGQALYVLTVVYWWKVEQPEDERAYEAARAER